MTENWRWAFTSSMCVLSFFFSHVRFLLPCLKKLPGSCFSARCTASFRQMTESQLFLRSWVYEHHSFTFNYFMLVGQLEKGQRIGMFVYIQGWKWLCALSRATTCFAGLRAQSWVEVELSYLIWKATELGEETLRWCVVGWGDEPSLRELVGPSFLQATVLQMKRWQLRQARVWFGRC